MRRFYLILLCLVAAIGSARAALTVTKDSDGTVVLTLSTTGDFGREFIFDNNTYSLKPSAKIRPYLGATKMRIVTTNGAKMDNNDIQALCGLADEKDNFPNLKELDMSEAPVENTAYNYDTRMKWLNALEKYTFPKSMTKIPNSLFSQHAKLKEVIIPDNLNRTYDIGQQAFQACPSLEKVYIGGRTSKVGSMAFNGCTKLKTLDFGYGSDNMVFDLQAFFGCAALEEVVLPEGLKEIGYGAFSGTGLRAIRLPSTLEYIRGTAFNCHFLESITIPEKVKQIEQTAFQENYNLKDVYVLGTNTKCAEQAFQPIVTYSYTYNGGSGNGEVVDPRQAFHSSSRTSITLFHYPKEAKDKYLNPHIKTLGQSGNTAKWAKDQYGNKFPIVDDGKFNGDGTEYAGWHDFMVAAETRDDEIFTDDVRIRDKWYSMCLPFDMTNIQLKSAYGATVEVVEFSDAVKTVEDGHGYITLKFKNRVTETKAHHPYMIHPGIHSGNLTGVKNTITGITKKPENEGSLQTVEKTADGTTYTFKGTYAEKAIPAYTYYYYNGEGASGNYAASFYKRMQTGGKWKKYTAVVLSNRDDGARAKANTLFYVEGDDFIDDNVTTSIAGETVPQVRLMELSGKVLNLNGQVVREDGASLNGLPRGIYIVNGKKYIVK